MQVFVVDGSSSLESVQESIAAVHEIAEDSQLTQRAIFILLHKSDAYAPGVTVDAVSALLNPHAVRAHGIAVIPTTIHDPDTLRSALGRLGTLFTGGV